VLKRRRRMPQNRLLCRRSSTTITSTEDITRNGGTIEGVWIFSRHGDRTPCRSLSSPHMADAESLFWRTKLPTPDPLSAFKSLSRCFPPEIHPSNAGKFLDVERRPFGFLTLKGVEQMKSNGERFFTRYDQYGHRCQQPNSDNTGVGNNLLKSWDVKVFSTNYLRTVTSAQSFLDGLLGTNCYRPSCGHSSFEEPLEIPNHATVVEKDKSKFVLSVQVRDRAKDTLNAFDRNPDLMMKLVGDVVGSPQFVARDATAAPLAARLANFMPGLVRKGRKVFGGPSGINWIDATDHFVCRNSHRVKFSRFSEFQHDDRVERTLQAMAHQTIAHLAWRFRQWYQSPPLLAAIASPPLREIASQMVSTLTLDGRQRHPLVLYSCHDVTILSLLYGVGAEFLADEKKEEWRFWPAYGTTLVFELVRINEINSEDSHVVRILLNGQPIKAVNLLTHKDDKEIEHVGLGPMNMLRVSDFIKIVAQLETIGGFDHSKYGVDDSEKERDMSNWTG